MKKKKFPTTLVVIALIVAIVLVGKNIIDHKTVDYTETVRIGLSEFFVTSDVTKLDPIIELLNKYEDEEEIRRGIQVQSLEIVGSWYTYLDNKYFCDYYNLNSCKAQAEEFKLLNNKLDLLYMKKCTDGFTIIVPSSYSNLKNQGEKKIKDISVVVSSSSSKNPQNSEEIRLRKCLVAVECDNCRDGICKCIYVDSDKNREPVMCKKDMPN